MSEFSCANGITESCLVTGGCAKHPDHKQVDHPAHYNQVPGVECIDVVEHLSFNCGNAIKYVWRAGDKPGSDAQTDLRKAIWYLKREIVRIEGEGK